MSKVSSVGVIIPCYNYGRFLKDCVLSVLSQEGVELRVLIIDDASTDSSIRIASDLAAADSRIELRHHSTNQGHIDTYNEGLDWADGTYTVVLDSDDILTQGALRRSCDLLDAHPGVGFVYGRVRSFYDDRLPLCLSQRPPASRIWLGSEWFKLRCELAQNCVLQPSVVLRTSMLKRVGRFRRELPHTADMEMWFRLSLCGDVGYIGGSYQALYRVHSAALHRSEFGTDLADLAQVVLAFESLFRDYKNRISNYVDLEAIARRNLARRALDAACRLYDSGATNLAQVSGLQNLALDTYTDAPQLGEWKSLRWRQAIGPLACLTLRPFLLSTIASRSLRKIRRYRLHKMGLL